MRGHSVEPLGRMGFFSARASLVAHLVKNLPTMPETLVHFLGRDNPLKKGEAINSSILAWRIPWTEELVGYSLWGCKETDMTE